MSSLPPQLGSVLAAHEYAEFPLAVDAGDEVRHGTFGSVAVQVVEQVLDVLDRRVLCLVDAPILDCPDMKELRRRRKAAEEEEEDEGDEERTYACSWSRDLRGSRGPRPSCGGRDS